MESTKVNEINVNWMDKELDELNKNRSEKFGESLPSIKLEENKVTEFEVDFSKEFDKWEDKEKGLVKKIIPVFQKGEKKLLWLNVRNPLYREIMERGKKGQKIFKVFRTGSMDNTKMTLVEQ